MKFGKINHLMLFGGSRIIAELVTYLKSRRNLPFEVYTSPRQLADILYPDGTTLKDYLENERVKYKSTNNINKEPGVLQKITPHTLGLGLGEAWSFSKKIIDRFDGRLLDLMGIRLPQYRGGAHYSWQILRGSRIGACHLQVINEDMVQGVFDSGQTVKSKEYFFPASVRIPEEYFRYAATQELKFISDFIEEVNKGQDFELQAVQEMFSLYFPRLSTLKHGFINWAWKLEDIEKFICAFDDPYAGASTFLNKKRVFLKKCSVEKNDGNFHPFQTGMVVRVHKEAVLVACGDGTLVLRQIQDQNKRSLLGQIKVGERFVTPGRYLDDAVNYSAEYSPRGL